jgi:periplasmic protein TonB
MKIAVFLLFISFTGFSQEISNAPPDTLLSDTLRIDSNYVYNFADSLPVYPGGPTAMMKFIRENITYSPNWHEIQGKVYVTFVVEKDGSITDVKVLRSLATPLDQEAIRVIKLMPKWKPGTHEGKPVRVRYNLPISIHPR